MTAEQKALIEHAAALEGRSITDFVLASVQDAAKRTIAEHEMIQLSVIRGSAPQPAGTRSADAGERGDL